MGDKNMLHFGDRDKNIFIGIFIFAENHLMYFIFGNREKNPFPGMFLLTGNH
jgi:hypothetical protein